MGTASLIHGLGLLLSPLGFAALVGLSVLLVWLAFAPSPAAREVGVRLDSYLTAHGDIVDEEEMRPSLGARVILPLARHALALLGRLAPHRNLARTEQVLIYAGRPGGLSALDLAGLRVLLAVLLAAGFYWLTRHAEHFDSRLIYTFFCAGIGYFLPFTWLRMRARSRQREIARALPDALDMMTIGVEAGLGFESSMLKVGERWDNALSRELRRVVTEMRVGTPRDEALRHMADRTGVEGVHNFVAVLVQSTQLGVSIAQVLHSQAEQGRLRRRQRAEELARQAGGKMVFPLVLFILPALFVVILGPVLPSIANMLSTARQAMGTSPR